ncbi:MAG: aminopeptidase P family protein [Rhodothermales bacterium]|nr:aminopeptidase P family protein [Rhodothermales bacterium]MBO6778625.1 aminopeptidase P family protein [Rhodothermales bacterium]
MRLTLLLLAFLTVNDAIAQEARRRWEMMAEIRRDKFDLVLPEVMRENNVDMWITMNREGNDDPLWMDFGQGYTGSTSYYVFTDRGGDRIERAALGVDGYFLEQSHAYDYFGSASELADFVSERDPQSIALNMSRRIGAADGLTHSGFLELTEVLGPIYAERFVSAEKLTSDFRSRRVATEIAAFSEAGQISKEIAERALSNEVITPGVTMLEDVAWWMAEEQFRRGLGTSFGMPSVYITGPDGIEALSDRRIIQRGDYLTIDWGVGLMNFHTDMKRIAYVLREGETEAPPGIQHAFDQGLRARDVLKRTIKPGVTALEAQEQIYAALEEAGFRRMTAFNQPSDDPEVTDVIIGSHSVGNLGHGIGPSIAFFNPLRITYELRPSNMLSIELFAYTSAPEWGGAKVRVALEDDAVITERGVEWLYPASQRILLIR